MNWVLFLTLVFLSGCSSATPQSGRSPNSWFNFGGGEVSGVRKKIIAEAQDHIGQKYVWDAHGPDTFDCSGFIYYVLRTVLGPQKFPLPYDLSKIGGGYKAQSLFYRDTLSKMGAAISCSKSRPADIVFFKAVGDAPNHIGFVTSPEQLNFLAAQSKQFGVMEQSFAKGTYWGSNRDPECFKNIWAENAE